MDLCLPIGPHKWYNGRIAAIVRHARHNFAKNGLIFLDIVLKRKHQLLHILGSHYYSALHLRLGRVWRKTYHINEKFGRTMRYYRKIGVFSLSYIG